MPKVTQPRRSTASSVEPPHISSTSCLGRCLYNIPQGTLVILMPGTVILLIGSFMVSLTNADSSYDDDLAYVSWLFVALGSVTTIIGIVFWSVLWTRNKPPLLPPKYRPKSPTESVQLVGVYKISDGHVNRAHTDDSGDASREHASDANMVRGDDAHTSDNSDVGHVNRARAEETSSPNTNSNPRRPHSHGSRHVTIQEADRAGHVNRAHTDDDGNVNPVLFDDKGAGAGDDGHSNAPQTEIDGGDATEPV